MDGLLNKVRESHAQIVEDLLKERVRQNEKFGWNRNHQPAEWLMILGEEVGEVNEEGINYTFSHNLRTDTFETLKSMRAELIQVAAVAMAFIEDLDDHYLLETRYIECISCNEEFDIWSMKTDDSDNRYCAECWAELAPIMKADFDEMVENGEIDSE